MSRVLTFRVLIVDDHPIFRRGLKDALRSQPKFRVVGEAASGREALRLVAQTRPHIVLLDGRLPGCTTAGILTELNRLDGSPRTIVIAEAMDQNEVLEALRRGARGVLSKESHPELLLKCIRSVLAGHYWIDQESILQLVEILKNPSKAPRECFGLTPRELQVASAIVDGLPNRDIARQFSISQQTVKHHLNSIYEKVGVSSRLELAMFIVHHDQLNGSCGTSSPPPELSLVSSA